MTVMSNLIATGSAHFRMIKTGKRSGSLEKSGQVDTLIPDQWLRPCITYIPDTNTY